MSPAVRLSFRTLCLRVFAVRVSVLPVPCQGPVQEDELQEGRAAVHVLGKSSQQAEGEGRRRQPERAALPGRLLLRRRLLRRLRRLAVSGHVVS